MRFLPLAAALALSVSVVVAQQPDDLARRIHEATALVDSGKADEAVAALKKIVAEHPDSTTAQYELALAYAAKGNNGECVKTLEPLAAANNVNALGMLGNCLDALGQHEKAIETYRNGLKLAPADSQLLFNLAVTLAKQGKLDESRELLKSDTRANPWHASGHLVLAKVFEAQRFRVPAIFSYLRFLAIEASPRSADAAAHLRTLLDLGVQTKGKNTNITIDPNGRKEEGDYSAMEMMVALASGSRNLEKNAKLSEFEQVQAQIALVINMFAENKPANDYTGAVQWPFFAAMKKEKLVDAFAAVVAFDLGVAGAQDWLRAHKDDMARYARWIDPQMAPPAVQLPTK